MDNVGKGCKFLQFFLTPSPDAKRIINKPLIKKAVLLSPSEVPHPTSSCTCMRSFCPISNRLQRLLSECNFCRDPNALMSRTVLIISITLSLSTSGLVLADRASSHAAWVSMGRACKHQSKTARHFQAMVLLPPGVWKWSQWELPLVIPWWDKWYFLPGPLQPSSRHHLSHP